MALPTNILQQVQTYQTSNLAFLENSNCFISSANTKYKNFEKISANFGDTVTFRLTPRYTVSDSLVASFQDSEQRVQALTIDRAKNVAYAFSAQEFILNVKDFMSDFGKSATAELSAYVEADVASVIPEHTFRFYGDGITAINSYGQLASALAYFRNFGAPRSDTKGYLSDIAVADIVNSGLTQFALDRNNETAQSWMVGKFSNTEWMQSNLLPIHTAGNVGENATTLTITAVTTDADGGISAITCSGGGADADAIKENDLLQFQDGVAGQSNVRYLTFVGHQASANTVQIRSTANAASAADSVTISISPKLYIGAGRNQNLNNAIAVGMQVKSLPSHRCGLICSGNPLFLAMPSLPEEVPYPTANETDPDTAVSMRMYYGSKFGENERGMIHDCIWGRTLVDEYAMRLVFPL